MLNFEIRSFGLVWLDSLELPPALLYFLALVLFWLWLWFALALLILYNNRAFDTSHNIH